MQQAVIYARYSPGPNQTEQSIEGQVRECTKYAELHDLRIVGTYIDRKISGKTDNRREFQRMIDDSEKHIFDVIILYHTDRFARNRYDSAIYKHKLKENGVELRYATTDIPKGPEGIILESIMEGWAEYYSAELSRKIKRGMRESALKCHSTGAGRCLGYRTAEDKSLVIEPEGAKAVQTVFDMYIKGKSHADICRYLNDCGFRTAQGKLFNKNSVTHIIRNKRYIGVYTYDDITIEDGIPAIISKDTFHLAQLEAARRKTAKRPKEPKAEYLLSGKAFCGHCQKPLVGVSGTGKSGNKWYYYYCQESRAKRGCTKKPVKRDWLEREVVKRTVAEVLQPEVIQHIAKKCYDLQMEYRQDNSDVLFYELKLKDVRKAIKNTMHAIESGVKTKTLPARLQELENEEEALEAELAIAKASDFVITADQIEFLLTQFAEPWECESEEEYHRRIIKCFVHKVFLFDDKLLIYYNVSRDGKTREQSEAELLEEALGEGFDKRSSGSTKRFKSEHLIFCETLFRICFDYRGSKLGACFLFFFLSQLQLQYGRLNKVLNFSRIESVAFAVQEVQNVLLLLLTSADTSVNHFSRFDCNVYPHDDVVELVRTELAFQIRNQKNRDDSENQSDNCVNYLCQINHYPNPPVS